MAKYLILVQIFLILITNFSSEITPIDLILCNKSKENVNFAESMKIFLQKDVFCLTLGVFVCRKFEVADGECSSAG